MRNPSRNSSQKFKEENIQFKCLWQSQQLVHFSLQTLNQELFNLATAYIDAPHAVTASFAPK